jgi:hypothetical protein
MAYVAERRQVLSEVRSHVRCYYYQGFVIGLEWHRGRGVYDREFGNVTGYINEPSGEYYVLPFRATLTSNYQQEIHDLVENCKDYVRKLKAADAALAALREHCFLT